MPRTHNASLAAQIEELQHQLRQLVLAVKPRPSEAPKARQARRDRARYRAIAAAIWAAPRQQLDGPTLRRVCGLGSSWPRVRDAMRREGLLGTYTERGTIYYTVSVAGGALLPPVPAEPAATLRHEVTPARVATRKPKYDPGADRV